MYLRTVRAKGAEGVEFEYIRLVEAYWENGRSKQRVVANLGRKDLLAPHLESLIELLGGGGKRTKGSSATCTERIEATVAERSDPRNTTLCNPDDLTLLSEDAPASRTQLLTISPLESSARTTKLYPRTRRKT